MMPKDIQRIEESLKAKYPEKSGIIGELVRDTVKNIHPIVMMTQGQFQAINDEVFTINGIVFCSKEICSRVRRSEYVFPHIISSGKEIEDYALVHTQALHRKIIRTVCAQSNSIGQSLVLQKLVDDYGVKQVLPMFPGETGWALQEGIRIFDIFGSLTNQSGLSITSKGTPNVAYTSYGLITGN